MASYCIFSQFFSIDHKFPTNMISQQFLCFNLFLQFYKKYKHIASYISQSLLSSIQTDMNSEYLNNGNHYDEDYNNTQDELTVGLRKKNQQNDLQFYESLATHFPSNQLQMYDQDTLTENFIETLQNNPEQYFNFGFTYNDFKAYLMKITFCRALRMFIEKKRLEKIGEFIKNNPNARYLCGFSQNEIPGNQQKTETNTEKQGQN